ncbi:precorrin-3B synthase [Microvirga sp. KLBC 81]|uniref:precorrin-3B synthase n=1 Tax=Microvirga sp. KLBC 81 TaxID=1862707 RepID=UPI000D51B74B|nr:precorrin-3B synthase [Microvirga sp. KLBC 81]PVE21413.1 precorrin-3B synthase [Microvirga sp. KLBC 81]
MTAVSTLMRRGWCPGVRRPMATGDGLLVRLHPLGGRLSVDQARLVADAARKHGNGHLDITGRGNLQIRGVRDETYPALLALLEREGLVELEGDGPNRLTVTSPLAGIDPLDRFDTFVLARAIEDKAHAIDGLSAKFVVAVDGGGSMPLDAIGADIHLLPVNESNMIAFGVPSSDGLQWIGATALARVPEAVADILSGYARMKKAGRTEARRLRDLERDLVRELADAAALEPTSPLCVRPPAPRAGILHAKGGKAFLLALPFGRCGSAQLEQAAAWSERFGMGEVRLSFTRGILLPGLAESHLVTFLDEARRPGFITEAQDPRLSLLACPGKPDCASALTPAPVNALRIASACGPLLSQGATLHVSGCRKGCAHPSQADLTLVGRDDGRYDVIPNGSTQDATCLHLSIDNLMTRLLPLNTLDDLRCAFAESAR